MHPGYCVTKNDVTRTESGKTKLLNREIMEHVPTDDEILEFSPDEDSA